MAHLQIGKIHFSWSEGLRIHSIKLCPESISATPLIHIEKFVINTHIFSSFVNCSPQVMINAQDIKINLVRYSNKKTNLSNWLERLTNNTYKKYSDNTSTHQDKSLHLPLDIKGFLSITGLAIDYQDHFLKKNIAISDTHLKLTSNSLLKSTIFIKILSYVNINHNERFPLKFMLNLKNLFNKNKTIKLDEGFISLFQNSNISWKGEIHHNFSTANLEISPLVISSREIMTTLQNILPDTFYSDALAMPDIKSNKIFWEYDAPNRKNQLKIIQLKMNSDQLSYKNNQRQIFAQSIALTIPELIMNQKSTTLIDIFCKELSVDIPNFEFTHEKIGRIKEPLILKFSANKMCVNTKDLQSSNASGTSALFQLGDILKIKTDALELKNKQVEFIGNVAFDVYELSKKLPLFRKKKDLKINGETQISWNIKGRLPDKHEINNMPRISDLNMKKHFPFLDSAEIEIVLNKGIFEFKPENKVNYFVGPVSTLRPLHYHYSKKQGTGHISTRFIVKQLDRTFHLKKDNSIDADINISGKHKDFKNLKLLQNICINDLGLKHTLKADISGCDRLLKDDIQSKLAFWFDYLGGTIKNNLELTDGEKLKVLFPSVELKGSLNIGSELDVIPQKSVSLKMFSQTDGIDFSLDQSISIKQIKATIDLKKTFHIVNPKVADKGSPKKTDHYLSSLVMETSKNSDFSETQHPINSRFIDQLQTVHHKQSTLSFRSLQFKTTALPIEINDSVIDFDLIKGIPHLERLQFEIWEGTVIASASIIKQQNNNFVRLQISFSGIDFNRILKNEYKDIAADSEINGQLFTVFPISFQFKEILRNLDFSLKFSHIGRQALERLLYALDPYENNEIIISQRKLLKTGAPIWIELLVRDGNLALTGEVIVGGITLNLPALTRFTITKISGLDSLEKQFISFAPVFKTFLDPNNI